MWDFVRFLSENKLNWNQHFSSVGQGVVAIYRDWQVKDLRLNPSTVNQRLNLITSMYEWAKKNELIDRLPFEYAAVRRRDVQHDFFHKKNGIQLSDKPNVLLAEWEKEPAFVTAEQLAAARRAIRSTSQRLLWDLMVRVGLRSVEARTFPFKYVFDPSERVDLKKRGMIDLRIDPADMEIKYSKSRVVAVPFSLMQDMWAYSRFERRLREVGGARSALILSVNGAPFSNSSAGTIFSHLSKRVGFKVTPLMLRHSYAIYTLLVLRSHPELQLEPLLYVRDRMGHSSVSTTMVYLRQIERLMGGEAEKLMSQYDALYGIS
jgi:integrase